MAVSSFRSFIRFVLAYVPLGHWTIIGLLSFSLIIFLIIRKKTSLYSASVLGIVFFVCSTLFETSVLIRCLGILPHATGYDFTIELKQLLQGSTIRKVEIISNFAVFVPIGFFLSEFLSTVKQVSVTRQIVYVTLIGLGFSLCIECSQFFLHVGFFELTDLVLNTVGAFVGAGLSALIRAAFAKTAKHADLLTTYPDIDTNRRSPSVDERTGSRDYRDGRNA